MIQYQNLVKEILNNGELKANRTGVDTLSITGAMLKCDLRNGFPILTTRKTPIKSTLTELEFFIKGITDKKWLEDRNCKFWSDWCNPEKIPYANDEDTKLKMKSERDLGEVYGYVWNNWESNYDITPVISRQIDKPKTPTFPLFDLVYSRDISEDSYIGTKYKNTEGHEYVILCKGSRDDARTSYTIQFLYTGYIKHNVRFDVIKKGNIKDPYHPSIYGIGFMGIKNPISNIYGSDVYTNLYKVWSHMIERCYHPLCKEYKYYGMNGVYVDARWHSFELFLSDVTSLPGWTAKLRYLHEYEIDKDYYGSNVYSKDTCVWIHHNDNILYRTSKAFYIIHKDGTKRLYISQTKCANDYGLSSSKISRVLLNKVPSHKGYKFKYVDDTNLYRYRLPINQLQSAIDKLKTNPTDRRLIVNAWNPAIIHKQALPPCHYVFELLSDGTYVDLVFNMRSSDVGLGLPANISSYAMLLMLIASQVNMIPRYLVYFGGDVHIYTNHIDQLNELLSRTPKELPRMEIIKSKPDNEWTIYDWNSQTDWKLTGYDPHSAIKMDVAV